ncbi:hypothetical protein Tco_0127579 [Tanacetum coccineum]
MTSNSVESINALTKDVRKLPITQLMDWFRDLLQKWYYERQAKHQDAPDDELTQWASAKVKRRMLKSANWTVKGVDENNVYEIREQQKIHVVYLEKGPNSGSGRKFEGRFGEHCGGNGGIGGFMSGVGEGIDESMGGMGGGSLARRSMVSNDR